MPLTEVPEGTVNVHGHLHISPSPTADRHINVSVEQLGFRPVRLSAVRRLARALVAGTPVAGDRTLTRVEAVGSR